MFLRRSERRKNGKRHTCRALFDPPHYDAPPEDETVLVRLKRIQPERMRDFGDVWMAWGLWRLLGLDRLLAELIPRGQEEVPWATMAAILVVANRRLNQHIRTSPKLPTAGLPSTGMLFSGTCLMWSAGPKMAQTTLELAFPSVAVSGSIPPSSPIRSTPLALV